MNNSTQINKEVEINAFYFSNGKNFKSFPKQITLDQKRYTFQGGLQMLVDKGQELIQIFNMTDGHNLYRLSFEPQKHTWTLLSSRSL